MKLHLLIAACIMLQTAWSNQLSDCVLHEICRANLPCGDVHGVLVMLILRLGGKHITMQTDVHA